MSGVVIFSPQRMVSPVWNAAVSQQVLRKTIKAFGQLDILVNNHGVQFSQCSIMDISDQQLNNTFRTNIFSFFSMIKATLPYMEAGSTIINTASVTFAGSFRIFHK